MKRPWKWVGIAAGMTAVLAGSLLLMGNLQSAVRSSQDAELARVEALARCWESRLGAAQTVFRDQILLQELLPVLEHPTEWTPWRVEPKLAAFQAHWPADAGALKSLLVFSPDGSLHSWYGDTAGAVSTVESVTQSHGALISFISATDEHAERLEFFYQPPQAEDDPATGFVIARVDPAGLLDHVGNAPQHWALLSDPQHALFSSPHAAATTLVNSATWPLLVSKESGSLKQPGNSFLTFCKVRVPGMSPLLLVTNMRVGSASGALVGMLCLGLGCLLTLTVYRYSHLRPSELAETPIQAHVAPANATESKAVGTDDHEMLPDPHSPYPILRVTPEGLLQYFNKSALRICPRVKDTPLLADVLSTVEPRSIPKLIADPSRSGFESLFGSAPHHFEVIQVEDGALLYGHPLSTSQSLEVALQQAQENFNALCAVSPYPILLVDPRNHVITEANAAAAGFFSTAPNQLRGRILDSLASHPIDLTASRSRFETDTADGHLTCTLHCEMVKVEGVPTVLASLEIPKELLKAVPHEEMFELDQVSRDEDQVAETRPLATGPALLVSFSPVVREVARRLLEKTGHAPEVFSTLGDAMTWLIGQGCRPEFVTIDITEFSDAPDWLAELRDRCGAVPCLAITDGVTDGLPAGPNALLEKPFDLDSVTMALGELGLAADLTVTL